MQTRLTFQCPQCNVGLNAQAEKAGRTYGCPNCSALVEVPTTRALVPVNRLVIVPEIVEDDELPRVPARRRKRRRDELVPVTMKMPGVPAEMKVKVDQKTSNAMATTFLGGLLVALGAIVVFMLGGKHKA